MMMIPCINMVQILVRNVTEYRVHRMIYQEKVWPKHAKSLVSRHMVIGFCFERRPAKCGRWRHAHYWWGRVGPLNCSSGCSDVVPLSVELPRKWFSSKNQQEICVYIYTIQGVCDDYLGYKRGSPSRVSSCQHQAFAGGTHIHSHGTTHVCLGVFFSPNITLPRSWWLNPHEFLLFGGYSAMLRMVSQGPWHSGARTS